MWYNRSQLTMFNPVEERVVYTLYFRPVTYALTSFYRAEWLYCITQTHICLLGLMDFTALYRCMMIQALTYVFGRSWSQLHYTDQRLIGSHVSLGSWLLAGISVLQEEDNCDSHLILIQFYPLVIHADANHHSIIQPHVRQFMFIFYFMKVFGHLSYIMSKS